MSELQGSGIAPTIMGAERIPPPPPDEGEVGLGLHSTHKYLVTSVDVQTWWASSHRLGHDLYHFWQCLEAVEGRWVHLHPKTTPTAQCE